MPRSNPQRKRPCARRKNQFGSQLSEVSAAIMILVLVVFIPLLDLTILPVRWMLAQEIVNGYSRKLALSETFSQAYRIMEADPSLATKLLRLGGVEYKSLKLRLRITRIFNYPHKEEFLIVEKPRQIPKEWLPDGAKAPCIYTLEIEIKSLISPAILLPAGGMTPIPGLNSPVPITIVAEHQWENLGRNPISKKFFVNE